MKIFRGLRLRGRLTTTIGLLTTTRTNRPEGSACQHGRGEWLRPNKFKTQAALLILYFCWFSRWVDYLVSLVVVMLRLLTVNKMWFLKHQGSGSILDFTLCACTNQGDIVLSCFHLNLISS